MRKLLRVNMATRSCTFEPLPVEYACAGGRALTSALVSKEVPPGCDPMGPENKLTFSPGLLGGNFPFKKNLLSISAKSPETGKIKSASASSTAAKRLEQLGIIGIIIENAAPQGEFLQLEIYQNRALLAASPVTGLGNFAAAQKLAEKYGSNNSYITVGPAGEAGLPAANIAFTDDNSQPVHYAGRGGLGAVMGAKGLKSIVVFPAQTAHCNMVFKDEFAKAAERFTLAMNTRHAFRITEDDAAGDRQKLDNDSNSKNFFANGCLTNCNLCSSASLPLPKKHNSKAIELAKLWKPGGQTDIKKLWSSFDALCNDLGVDAFITGSIVAKAMDSGVLPAGNVEAALAAVRTLCAASPLTKMAIHGLKTTESLSAASPKKLSAKEGKLITQNQKDSAEPLSSKQVATAFADAAGICAVVVAAALKIPEARAAIIDMLNAKYGCAFDANYISYLAKGIIEQEKEFNGAAALPAI